MRGTVFTLSLLFSFFTSAQGIRVSGKFIVDKKSKEIILRGIGLGGWMLQEPYMMQLSGITATQQDIKNKISSLIGPEQTKLFYTSWLKNHCTKADIDSLAAWGFNSVRLPMHYNLFTLPAEQEKEKNNTWLKEGFELTDSLLKWCKAAKIYLILDLHAAPGGQGNDIAIADRDTTKPYLWGNEENKTKVIALWKKLAERYANEEWLGAYDLLNEPNYGFSDSSDKNGCAEKSNTELKQFYNEVIHTIRQVDKKHIVIVEGNCWGNNYNGLLPFEDKNVVVSFHKYWNYNDEGSIKKFLDLREQYNIPVWCGETGENSNVWFTDAISLLEKNKIGWAMWPLKKIGINNLLEIKPGDNYKQLVSYWKGGLNKPTPEEVVTALQQLTKKININQNVGHKDVLDALFRQPFTTAIIPFKANRVNDKAIIYATDYDMGRHQYAYCDKDTGNYWVSNSKRTDWNKGKLYRNDGVDINKCTDSLTNNYCVIAAEEGEWIQYTINVVNSGSYKVSLRIKADTNEGGIFSITADSTNGTNEILLNNPIDTNRWVTVSAKPLSLQKGLNRLRLYIKKGIFSLNYIELIRAGNIHDSRGSNSNSSSRLNKKPETKKPL